MARTEHAATSPLILSAKAAATATDEAANPSTTRCAAARAVTPVMTEPLRDVGRIHLGQEGMGQVDRGRVVEAQGRQDESEELKLKQVRGRVCESTGNDGGEKHLVTEVCAVLLAFEMCVSPSGPRYKVFSYTCPRFDRARGTDEGSDPTCTHSGAQDGQYTAMMTSHDSAKSPSAGPPRPPK